MKNKETKVGKFRNLKKWLTIGETARHLSLLFDEPISNADVLQLGLEKQLQLSVNIVNFAEALKVMLFPISQAFDPNNRLRYEGIDAAFPVGTQMIPEGRISVLHGIYDLPMLGGELLDIESRYQALTGGPEVSRAQQVEACTGALVATLEGEFCEIQTPLDNDVPLEKLSAYRLNLANYTHAESLPHDAVLVVRTSALAKFESSISNPDYLQDKPLGTTERTTLLTIIAALAKEAKVPISQPSKATDLIAKITQEMRAPVSKRAIEEKLKLIDEALQSRTRS